MNPWDVEGIWLPPVSVEAVATARLAWAELVKGPLNGEAVTLLERLLGHVGGGAEG